MEILEERLKIVESELQRAQEKAERLENQSKVSPPLPPPPPPLPPPFVIAKPVIITTTQKIPLQPRPDEMDIKICVNDEDVIKSPVVLRKLAPQPAIDDLVNQIKGGKFSLKSTNKDNKKEREEPEAVSEMLKILGTLRRCPKPRNSLNKTVVDLGDIQL